MIAQDTGGAIVGPARADLYFGAGDEAASVAGRLRHYGKFVMLVPKALLPLADDEIHCPGRVRST
jgi:membrane-bound lytic murein transglycosylase A